jgi:hypothetical protein
MVVFATLSLGMHMRVWSRLLTSVSPACAALSVGSASSSDDRQRCFREDRAYRQAHERKLQLRMSLFSSYLHMMHNAVDSLRATPYGDWIDSNSVRLTTYPANSTFLSPVNGRTE